MIGIWYKNNCYGALTKISQNERGILSQDQVEFLTLLLDLVPVANSLSRFPTHPLAPTLPKKLSKRTGLV